MSSSLVWAMGGIRGIICGGKGEAKFWDSNQDFVFRLLLR